MSEVQPDPAPVVEDPSGHPIPGGGVDQPQASILAGAPDVGWFSAFGCLARIR
jgi:hypothetical protein